MSVFRINPTLRIAMGLVGLCVTLLILADALVGLFNDRAEHARELRTRIAESTTVLVTESLRQQDYPGVGRVLEAARQRNADLVSVGVRPTGSPALAQSGPHAEAWTAIDDKASSLTHVIVPIHSARGTWGRAEFEFKPVSPVTLVGWLHDRTLWVALALPAVALGLVYFYLRRTLVHLNPLSVVPERLRAAFDGLTEGVALLDARGHVVLANHALRELAAVDAARMHGRPLAQAARLSLPDASAGAEPWLAVLRTGETLRGVRVLVGEGDQQRVGVLNCSPILDPQGAVRGCMATIDDQTQIERSNDELRSALEQLEQSRAQIEAQNQELLTLATRDSLTGLLNRRAFFDSAKSILARHAEQGGTLAVLMLDVDHFKSFNDRYGHAVGDQVLQRVAKSLTTSLRLGDLIARYGGEEFCILLEVSSEAMGVELAERVRRTIQLQAGAGLRDGSNLTITVSVGVALCPPLPGDLSALLKQADDALYQAKRGGRNRVVVASATDAPTAETPAETPTEVPAASA